MVQALHIADQLLHPLVRIAQALHAMADTGHRTMVLLHVGQEFVDRHLIVDGMLKEPSGIGDSAAESADRS